MSRPPSPEWSLYREPIAGHGVQPFPISHNFGATVTLHTGPLPPTTAGSPLYLKKASVF